MASYRMAKHVILNDLRLVGIALRADPNVNVNGLYPLRGAIFDPDITFYGSLGYETVHRSG